MANTSGSSYAATTLRPSAGAYAGSSACKFLPYGRYTNPNRMEMKAMRAAPGPSGPSAPRQGVHPQDPPHQVNLPRAHGVSRPVPIPNRTAGERRSGPRASRSGQSDSGIAACSQAGNRTVRPSSHMRGVDRERSKMWAERASCWAPRRSGAAAAINTHGVSPTGTARSSAAVTIRLGSGAGCRGACVRLQRPFR